MTTVIECVSQITGTLKGFKRALRELEVEKNKNLSLFTSDINYLDEMMKGKEQDLSLFKSIKLTGATSLCQEDMAKLQLGLAEAHDKYKDLYEQKESLIKTQQENFEERLKIDPDLRALYATAKVMEEFNF